MLTKIRKALPIVLALPLLSFQAAADVMWTYDSDIDQTPHYLRVNRITETSPPDEEIAGFEIDGRYAVNDQLGLVARYSFGSGESVEEEGVMDSKLKIADIGLTYGMPFNDQLFYELKAVYNYRKESSSMGGESEARHARSIRITPRVRYDFNQYLQARALVEFEKPEHMDVGSEAAIYLTLIPMEKLAFDFKFGKGITNTEHDSENGKWSNDNWYVEPRISYRINSMFSLEVAYRDKKEGGRFVDFGVVTFFE